MATSNLVKWRLENFDSDGFRRLINYYRGDVNEMDFLHSWWVAQGRMYRINNHVEMIASNDDYFTSVYSVAVEVSESAGFTWDVFMPLSKTDLITVNRQCRLAARKWTAILLHREDSDAVYSVASIDLRSKRFKKLGTAPWGTAQVLQCVCTPNEWAFARVAGNGVCPTVWVLKGTDTKWSRHVGDFKAWRSASVSEEFLFLLDETQPVIWVTKSGASWKAIQLDFDRPKSIACMGGLLCCLAHNGLFALSQKTWVRVRRGLDSVMESEWKSENVDVLGFGLAAGAERPM